VKHFCIVVLSTLLIIIRSLWGVQYVDIFNFFINRTFKLKSDNNDFYRLPPHIHPDIFIPLQPVAIHREILHNAPLPIIPPDDNPRVYPLPVMLHILTVNPYPDPELLQSPIILPE
jgi:hypothetical protein